LVVNVASKCGFTPQYEGLEALYRKYKERGLVVLGFPSNDFLWQEPGTNEEISEFCVRRYGVTFPMFAKISVRGRKQHPLYAHLTSKKGRVTWNFNKFLVDAEGQVIRRFGARIKPDAAELVEAIESALAA
jgi:glutathione peroxidase